MESSFTDRVVISFAKRRHLDGPALRALMKANELFGLALGVRLAKLRDSDEPLQSAFAEVEVQALQARLFHEASQILAERWDKVPDRRRPQYRPELRYRILRLKKLMAWSRDETALLFRVSSGTITRWEQETENHPERKTVGSLVKPQPPVRRYADVVRQIVRSMDLAGFGGNRRIAQTLARAGWKVAKDTVRRAQKEKPPKPTETPMATKIRVVKARYPNHVFMADLTEVPGLFRIFQFKVAAVIDVFSRMPVATRVFFTEPSANAIAELFHEAVDRFGVPRHFVSDQGSQFTAESFRNLLKDLDVRQRFGAIGETGSIALIERLWRSFKDLSRVRTFKPLVLEDLKRRLRLSLTYYAHYRPHQGLGGATPAEKSTTDSLRPISPPASPRERDPGNVRPKRFSRSLFSTKRKLFHS